jgi:putative transposase
MGRAARSYQEGHAYHLTAHGIDDRPIFVDDLDRQDFVIRLGRVARTHLWSLHAWCLMDTHYHLLVTPGRIAQGMRVLNGGYSRAFNVRHTRRGALFESRYRDRQIRDEQHMYEAIRYIEGNRGTPDWPWRSRTGV